MNEEGSSLSRVQALKMLHSIPAGEKIAIYALRGKLQVICEFTSDQNLLIRQLRRWKPTPTTPAPEPHPSLQAQLNPAASSAPKMVWFIEDYVVKPFEDVPLGKLNRFEIQVHLNSLPEMFSRSVVVNFRTYIRAILDEALDQDFIAKNPARKLMLPITRKASKRTLSVEEIAELLAHMDGRDRLIVRMFLVHGLRPGELFALRRDDRLASNCLRIDQSVSPLVGIVDPKSEASNAFVWMPQSVVIELDFWMESQTDKRPEAFIFPSRKGTPLSANNFLKRVLKKAGEGAREELLKEPGVTLPNGFLEGLTHQALRRSCATHMQPFGSVKDIQAHLRHARPNVTAEVYMQEIPANVRAAVELLDQKLTSVRPKVSEAVEPN